MTGRLHDDELKLDITSVRRLVDRAFPRYASLPLRPVTEPGSSNVLFRLGDELVLRLPRQASGSADILFEARWLPVVRPLLPVAVPDLVSVVEPGADFPAHWSVVRWVEGRRPPVPGVDPDAGLDRRRLALDLAGVIGALRAVPLPPTPDPDLQSYRGEPLADLDPQFRRYVAGCQAIPDLGLDLDAASELWTRLVHQEPQPVRPLTWLHGDLLAENLLVHKGRLAAVLDFGGLAIGDPTVDLVVAWEVLDVESREVFREALGVDDVTWSKGRAWALAIAMMTFPYYWHSMPRRCADRRSMALAALSGR